MTDLPRFAARAAVAIALVALAAAAWVVRDALLLAFAGVLLALALRAGADALARRLHWSPAWGLAATVAGVTAALGLVGWLIGDRVAGQIDELARTLPQNLDRLRDWLQGTAMGGLALRSLESLKTMGESGESLLRAAGFAYSAVGALGSAALVVAVSLYLAADPKLYLDGALRLAPRRLRPRIERGLRAAGESLRAFLLGQAVAMTAVGLMTGLGLWLLDVPLALTLAIIAALLDFVPFFGPVVAAAPALLLAFTRDPQVALYVALLYAAIQQVEATLISPLIQKKAVSLPPALGILAIVAFGVLLGPLGVVLGAPLTVMTIALVRQGLTDEDGPDGQPS